MASPMASTLDHLFAMRNSFYLGAYQAAINCADSLPPLPGGVPREGIARFPILHRPQQLSGVRDLKFKGMVGRSCYWKQCYLKADRWALKHTNYGRTMDLHALNVQIFIKMHRVDYAEKLGGSKIRETHLIFQDFSEKYQMTVLVLNGKAVCCMQMGNSGKAETSLLEALNKDTKDPETLANLVVCSLHLGKPASCFLSQLKLSNPDHVPVKWVSSAEESFDRAVQTVA